MKPVLDRFFKSKGSVSFQYFYIFLFPSYLCTVFNFMYLRIIDFHLCIHAIRI